MSKSAVLFAAAGLATAANAQVIMGFQGPFDPANWTEAKPGNSSVDWTNAPDCVTIIGNDDGSGLAADTFISIIAPDDAIVCFDWTYFSSDVGDWDSGGYHINNNPIQLADNDTHGSGSASFPVNAGNTFGWYVHSRDSGFGPGVLETATSSSRSQRLGR